MNARLDEFYDTNADRDATTDTDTDADADKDTNTDADTKRITNKHFLYLFYFFPCQVSARSFGRRSLA